jgi:hypothetical protein
MSTLVTSQSVIYNLSLMACRAYREDIGDHHEGLVFTEEVDGSTDLVKGSMHASSVSS